MEIDILKTGSAGNCTIVENKFMLDCGISYRNIERVLPNIKLIFISHKHSDHLNSSTVKKVAYNFPNIKFLCGKELYETMRDLGLSAKQLICIETSYWFDMGMCRAKLDMLYHDVPNYCLHLFYKGKYLLYATDTSKIDHIVAKYYDYYLIEANYETDEELDQKIMEAHEKGEFTHLERVRYTHLSQLQALNWLENNKGEKSKYIFMHEHKERK